VRLALAGLPIEVHCVVAGLGGRAITSASLERLLADGLAGRLPALTFLDLRADIVSRELARLAEGHRSGPHAENILRDVGVVASGAV